MNESILESIGLYLSRIGIALSVLLNVILGGYSNQTFSARNYAWQKRGCYNLVWVIDSIYYYWLWVLNIACSSPKLDPLDHCMRAWVYWRVRKDVIHGHSKGDIYD